MEPARKAHLRLREGRNPELPGTGLGHQSDRRYGQTEPSPRLSSAPAASPQGLETLYASLSQKAFAGELDLERVKV